MSADFATLTGSVSMAAVVTGIVAMGAIKIVPNATKWGFLGRHMRKPSAPSMQQIPSRSFSACRLKKCSPKRFRLGCSHPSRGISWPTS